MNMNERLGRRDEGKERKKISESKIISQSTDVIIFLFLLL